MLKEPQLHLLRQRLAANEGDGDVAGAGTPTAPRRGRAECGSFCRRKGQQGGATVSASSLCILDASDFVFARDVRINCAAAAAAGGAERRNVWRGAGRSRQSQATAGAALGGPSHYAQVKQSQAAGLPRLGFIIVSATKELNSCQAHHQPR